MKAAYEKFRSRGFEILGMNFEYRGQKAATPEDYKEATEKAADYVAKNGMTWPEAAQESIYDIIVNRFLVRSYPTTILVDPEGKIVALGGDLRKDKLAATLEKLLAEKPVANLAK